MGAIGPANRRAIVGFWFVWRWEDLEPGGHLSEERRKELKRVWKYDFEMGIMERPYPLEDYHRTRVSFVS